MQLWSKYSCLKIFLQNNNDDGGGGGGDLTTQEKATQSCASGTLFKDNRLGGRGI